MFDGVKAGALRKGPARENPLFRAVQQHFVNLDEGRVCVAVVRPRLEVFIQAIPEAEWEFLSLLANRFSLDDAFKAALGIDPRFNLAAVLQARLADKTIIDTVPEE